MSILDAIAQSCATRSALLRESEAIATKGMCQDDYEWYAQRLGELECHLAYLRHVWQAEEDALYAAELAAYKECPGEAGPALDSITPTPTDLSSLVF